MRSTLSTVILLASLAPLFAHAQPGAPLDSVPLIPEDPAARENRRVTLVAQ